MYYVDMEPRRAVQSAAKRRILETADRLFYREGVRAVGIDRIIAEAQVAKMTLYAHFPSKDALILAVLEHREAAVLDFFTASMARHGRRIKDPLRAFFAALKEWFETPGFRGCAFQNAAVELADPDHAGTRFVREHKLRFAETLRGLVERSIGKSSGRLVRMIALLVEGAIVTAVIQGSSSPAETARDAALELVAGVIEA